MLKEARPEARTIYSTYITNEGKRCNTNNSLTLLQKSSTDCGRLLREYQRSSLHESLVGAMYKAAAPLWVHRLTTEHLQK